MSNSNYPNLWNIIVGYFHEDFDLFGKDIEEIIAYHKEVTDISILQSTVDEIEKFKLKNHDCLDLALKNEFGSQFNPKLWGHTTASFFDELTRLLKA